MVLLKKVWKDSASLIICGRNANNAVENGCNYKVKVYINLMFLFRDINDKKYLLFIYNSGPRYETLQQGQFHAEHDCFPGRHIRVGRRPIQVDSVLQYDGHR